MKILGLIVEYNPFHNGHLYHLTKSKARVQPDLTVAVMSGHFTQRGEPALTNKWARTDFALAHGIDLVIELPYAYSNQSADFFALGALSLLMHVQATHLVFGSEVGCIESLTNLSTWMQRPDVRLQVKKHLAAGLSLPAAYQKENPNFIGPNNTLGIHYLRAIKKLGASIEPLTLARFASGYNDSEVRHAKIASATAIRKRIDQGADISAYTPIQLDDAHVKRQNWEHHYPFLRHKLLTHAPSEIAAIHDVVEGIENRLIAAAMAHGQFSDFLNAVATKRYTRTRIQRICANVLTGTTKKDIQEWDLSAGAPYIRVLGFSEKGAAHLRQLGKKTSVPIYSTFGKDVHNMLKHEQRVSAAYASVYPPDVMTQLIKCEYASHPKKTDINSADQADTHESKKERRF